MLQLLDDQPEYVRMIFGALMGSLIIGFPGLISTVWDSWIESRGQSAFSRVSAVILAMVKYMAAVVVFAVIVLLSNCDGCGTGIDDYQYVERW